MAITVTNRPTGGGWGDILQSLGGAVGAGLNAYQANRPQAPDTTGGISAGPPIGGLQGSPLGPGVGMNAPGYAMPGMQLPSMQMNPYNFNLNQTQPQGGVQGLLEQFKLRTPQYGQF